LHSLSVLPSFSCSGVGGLGSWGTGGLLFSPHSTHTKDWPPKSRPTHPAATVGQTTKIYSYTALVPKSFYFSITFSPSIRLLQTLKLFSVAIHSFDPISTRIEHISLI